MWFHDRIIGWTVAGKYDRRHNFYRKGGSTPWVWILVQEVVFRGVKANILYFLEIHRIKP